MTINHTSWAEYLQAAADERREVQGIQSQVHELSIADAYRIQDALIARRLVTGDSLAGAKLGLTSKAKQEQMGVSEPAYGWVTASAVLPERGRRPNRRADPSPRRAGVRLPDGAGRVR